METAEINALLASIGSNRAESKELPNALKEIPKPSNHYSNGVTSSIEERALKLLGNGVKQEAVASALGVSPSRITQLLSNQDFADQVAKLRYDALQNHNARDASYDSLEDSLLEKLKSALPLMVKPDTILNAMKVVNAAKRRGAGNDSGAGHATTNIVNLVLPQITAEHFVLNSNNQVTKAGNQSLHTMSSGNLLKRVEEAEQLRLASAEESPDVLSP